MRPQAPTLFVDGQRTLSAEQLALANQRRADHQLILRDAHDKRPAEHTG